jgi:hypothetical protein
MRRNLDAARFAKTAGIPTDRSRIFAQEIGADRAKNPLDQGAYLLFAEHRESYEHRFSEQM